MMAANAWLAWGEVRRTAEREVQHSAGAAAEYAGRVLSSHAAAAGRIDAALRHLSDAEIRAREHELHATLKHFLAEVPQAEAGFVLDRQGSALLGANVFPVPRSPGLLADRDFFLALRSPNAPLLHVSQVYTGRLDPRLFFTVSRRRTETGNQDLPPGAFDGLINVSLYPGRIAEGLQQIAPREGDDLTLLRADGEVLARSGLPLETASLPGETCFTASLKRGDKQAFCEGFSAGDGEHRLYGLQRVEGWPVYAIASRSRSQVTAAWHAMTQDQLAVGLPATLALLALAMGVRRGQIRLAAANNELEARVSARTAQLAEKEARLKEAFEAGRVFACEFNPATDLVVRSSNAESILGLPDTAATCESGSDFLAAVHPEDVKRVLAPLSRVKPAYPTYTVRFRYCRADGSVIWLQDHGIAHFGEDGRIARLTSLTRDVTAEMEAELAQRESETRLRAATEGAGLGVYEVNLEQHEVWFDARAAAILGHIPPAGVWLSLQGPEWAAVEEQIHPDDRPVHSHAFEAAVHGCPDSVVLECRIRSADHKWTWVWCRGTALPRDPDRGLPRRLIGVMQDVTKRHRLEAELRQGQKLQAMGALAGGIAHDFNNVLQTVAGAAAMTDRAAEDPAAVRCRMGVIAEAVERGASITGRLLAFSRQDDLCTVAMDPQDLLHGLRAILAPALGARIAVHIAVQPGVPPLLADREQLETALINLATNARDAMPEGGTVAFSAEADRVEDATGSHRPAGLTPGRYIRLTVRDSGMGMDTEMLARVGEPFFTTKPPGKGTGLGLSMAKRLAEQSGGGLSIQSAPGRGTTVTLWFPEAAETAVPPTSRGDTAATERIAATARMHAPYTILLVEDELSVRETMIDQLEAVGFRIVPAANGEEALALLDAGDAVDVMVTDLTMPGLDGLALIDEVRRRRPGLPAVLLTGYAEEATSMTVQATQGGSFVLLRKPTSGATLAKRVLDMIETTSVG